MTFEEYTRPHRLVAHRRPAADTPDSAPVSINHAGAPPTRDPGERGRAPQLLAGDAGSAASDLASRSKRSCWCASRRPSRTASIASRRTLQLAGTRNSCCRTPERGAGCDGPAADRGEAELAGPMAHSAPRGARCVWRPTPEPKEDPNAVRSSSSQHRAPSHTPVRE